jgi:hypothetical protein
VATFEIGDGRLALRMSRLERLEAIHERVDAPLASVTNARAVADAWSELRGIRAPGTGVPGLIAVGTRRGKFGKDFAVVHGRGPAVVVEFATGEFHRWVVTIDDAEHQAEVIRRAIG